MDGLLLLHWFANTVSIDNNDIWLTFDPNGDYGSHCYYNREGMLEEVPRGSQYYTVGNLRYRELEDYLVVAPMIEYDGNNSDRIIFRVRQQNTRFQIESVYVTEHYHPKHTYRITTDLLIQMRNINREQFIDLLNTWDDLASLELLLIVTQEKYSLTSVKRQGENNIPETGQNSIDASETFDRLLPDQTSMIKLEVMTGTNGKARISWSNIPRHRRKGHMMVVLFKNNEDQEVLAKELIGYRESGSCQTSIPLNNGLQARLHEGKNWYCFWKVGEEICRGSEFNNPKAVQIAGYNAWLQLFVKDGKASARLYVEKSFREWRYIYHSSTQINNEFSETCFPTSVSHATN
uniref:Uncharacterized protein n=1 Tax=Mastacembelus armatus TaxID=205130 RepID=A0A3Q3NGH0_9TELE